MAEEVAASLTWTIENFDKLVEDWEIPSPAFNAGSYSLQLKLVLHSGDLDFYLVSSGGSGNSCPLRFYHNKCQLWIADEGDNTSIWTGKILHENRPFCSTHHFLQLAREKLLAQKRLMIRFDIESLDDVPEFAWEAAEREAKLFANHMEILLESGAHSDMELVSKEGKNFKVHKFILHRRCAKLMASLEQALVKDQAIATDVDGLNLRKIINYAYTGTLDTKRMNSMNYSLWNSMNYSLWEHLYHFGLMDSVAFQSSRHHESVSAVTIISSKKLSLKWLAKDCSELKTGHELVCPMYGHAKKDWDYLIVTLTRQTGENEDRVWIDDFIMQLKNLDCKKSVPVWGKVLVKKQNDIVHEEGFREEIFGRCVNIRFRVPEWNDDATDCDLNFFIDISTLKNEDRVVSLSITAEAGSKPNGVIENIKKLLEDLQYQSEDQKFSDVTLCTGNQTYKAHKAMLAARSPGFARLIENQDVSKERLVFNIDDVPPNALKNLLRYIYGGGIPCLTCEDVASLYSAAGKYDLHSLMENCEKRLKESLTADSVGEALLSAHAQHNESWKRLTYDFVARNLQDVMTSNETLVALRSEPQLYQELFEAIAEILKSSTKSTDDPPRAEADSFA